MHTKRRYKYRKRRIKLRRGTQSKLRTKNPDWMKFLNTRKWNWHYCIATIPAGGLKRLSSITVSTWVWNYVMTTMPQLHFPSTNISVTSVKLYCHLETYITQRTSRKPINQNVPRKPALWRVFSHIQRYERLWILQVYQYSKGIKIDFKIAERCCNRCFISISAPSRERSQLLVENEEDNARSHTCTKCPSLGCAARVPIIQPSTWPGLNA